MALTPDIIKMRVQVTEALDEIRVLREDGLLPNGRGVADIVNDQGEIDLHAIGELCGIWAVRRVRRCLNEQKESDPSQNRWEDSIPAKSHWSKRTADAEGKFHCDLTKRKIKRGPRRYSNR